MALDERAAAKGVRDHGHAKVTAAAGAGVARVARGVVDDLEHARRQRALDGAAQLRAPRFGGGSRAGPGVQRAAPAFHGAPSTRGSRVRVLSHSTCSTTKPTVRAVSPKILKLTHARSLAR